MRNLFLYVTIVLIAASAALASPSLSIQKTPERPAIVPLSGGSMLPTGPGAQGDPYATQGQWFYDYKAPGAEKYEVFNWEYHDEWGENPGNDTGDSIHGYVSAMEKVNGKIKSFTITATITNDYEWQDYYNTTTGSVHNFEGNNALGEKRDQTIPYYDPEFEENLTLCVPHLTIEFAKTDAGDDCCLWPTIYATNEDHEGWYGFSSDPDNGKCCNPDGSYCVPAWEFSDLAPGESETRNLTFEISGDGLCLLDYRYWLIEDSFEHNTDILKNRAESLKISQWTDSMGVDEGSWRDCLFNQYSTCSVFHARLPEPATLSILAIGSIGLVLRKRTK